ncbi:MAG: class I SAM-dependent methyltransferase [Gallionella sp.]|nr:class I SAM-dependent methyltransferase [Gallionella sp.]
MNDYPIINWNEADEEKSARWRSESGTPPPRRVVIADDRMTADAAYRLACEGTALLWRGDFQNARQLLQAMARRADEIPRRHKNRKIPATLNGHTRSPLPVPAGGIPAASGSKAARTGETGEGANESLRELHLKEAFHLHRLAQSQRARTLGMLLIPFEADHSIPLRRAPDARAACTEAYGAATEPYVASLRGLQGLVGAYEWRKNGVEIPALGARIHPHYGVFAPIRGEYIGLVNEAPLPELTCIFVPLSPPLSHESEREQTNRCANLSLPVAFDIGTGTGVLAAVLARRGIKRIVATDQDQRALACARENLARLGLAAQVDVVQADLFPEGRAPLVVCNPPWIPARPSSPLEHAIFDPESRMLRGFLNGLAAHLEPGGEGWLILSDLAEHLGLRTRAELLAAIDAAGLQVLGKIDVKPHHPRVSDTSDPLHTARAAELTSLWRLAAAA